MKPTKLLLALMLVLLVAGLLLIAGMSKLPERVPTRFSPKFSTAAFSSLRVGEEFSVVTNLLGAPLDFTVIPQDPNAITNNPLSRTDPAELVRFASNGRDLVLMRYSQPNWLDHYKAYEVSVRGGKVVEKRSYWYWD